MCVAYINTFGQTESTHVNVNDSEYSGQYRINVIPRKAIHDICWSYHDLYLWFETLSRSKSDTSGQKFNNPSSSGPEYKRTHIRSSFHDDVIKWKYFPRYRPFVRGIHRSSVNSPHKGQWHGALVLSLICAWIKRLSKQLWEWWF